MTKKLSLLTVIVGSLALLMTAASPPPKMIAPISMTTAGSNLVAKAQGGYLYGFIGTTGSTAGCYMVFNATSLPANGTVTPAIAPIIAPANTSISFTMGQIQTYMSTGITIGFSTNCSLSPITLAASSTVVITAWVQ